MGLFLGMLWLYNRTGDRSLLDLARKLRQQGHDWEAQFANFKTTEKVTRRDANLSTHGVNNAMALKAAAVWWLVTGDRAQRDALYRQFAALDRHLSSYLIPDPTVGPVGEATAPVASGKP